MYVFAFRKRERGLDVGVFGTTIMAEDRSKECECDVYRVEQDYADVSPTQRLANAEKQQDLVEDLENYFHLMDGNSIRPFWPMCNQDSRCTPSHGDAKPKLFLLLGYRPDILIGRPPCSGSSWRTSRIVHRSVARAGSKVSSASDWGGSCLRCLAGLDYWC